MKLKFSLGWILSIIAALAIALLTFFSSNFQHLGDKVGISIIIAVILVAALLVIAYYLVQIKKVSMPVHFHKAALIETLLLLLFVFIAFVSVLTTNHFYAVMGRKDVIQTEVKTQIYQMDNMFASYNDNVKERTTNYKSLLESIKKNKKNNLSAYEKSGLNDYSVNDLVALFHSSISCDVMQSQIMKWENDMMQRTSGLGLVRLMPRIPEIDQQLNAVHSTLAEKSKIEISSDLGGYKIEPKWTYTLTIGNNIMKNFQRSEDEKLSIWAFVISILASFLMLLPYIAAERDGRSKGLIWELLNERKNHGI